MIVPTIYGPPSPNTLEEVISWIRNFAENGPPIDPGTLGTDPSLVFVKTNEGRYLAVNPSAGGGSATAWVTNATSPASQQLLSWLVTGISEGQNILIWVGGGFSASYQYPDRQYNIVFAPGSAGGFLGFNDVPSSYNSNWGSWVAYTLAELIVSHATLIRDLKAKNVLQPSP